LVEFENVRLSFERYRNITAEGLDRDRVKHLGYYWKDNGLDSDNCRKMDQRIKHVLASLHIISYDANDM
jgi:hypothetical protein